MPGGDKPTRVLFPLRDLFFPYRPRLLWGKPQRLMRHSVAPTVQHRLRIISAAADLFYEKGFHASSRREICKAAGVTLQQLHHHFGTKGDIAEAVVQGYLTEIKGDTSQLYCKLDNWKGLARTFAAHIGLLEQFNMRRGCPLGIIGNELTDKDEAIRVELKLVFEALKGRIGTFLKNEKSAGRLLRTADQEQLAEFCVATIQGAMLIGKVRRNSSIVKRIFEDLWMHLGRYRIEEQKP